LGLSNGRSYLAIPGPSVMPERVLQAMHLSAPDIYKGPLVDMMPGLVRDLKAVARTRHNVAIYIANGHGVWEAAIANVLAPGDKVLVLASGAFGLGWAEIAERLRVDVEIIDAGTHTPFDPLAVARRLAQDDAHRIKAVMTVHVDTSTSVKSDIASLRAVMDESEHPALLMVDCIASLGCDQFEMDDWGVDVVVAASQKGLMTPPGIGFVFFNDKAASVAKHNEKVSWYWDWAPRVAPERFYFYFGGTAPTHHLYGLREALNMLGEEGLENVWARHASLARLYWAAIDAWSAKGEMRFNVAKPGFRSNAVTAIEISASHGAALRDWVEQNTGVTLGVSLGMQNDADPAGDRAFRIGHMGHLNPHMVLGVVAAIDAGLVALGIEHGDGALAAAVEQCAKG